MSDYCTEINEYTPRPQPCQFPANVVTLETEILNPGRHPEFSVFSKETEIEFMIQKLKAVKINCPFFLLIVLHTAPNINFLSEKLKILFWTFRIKNKVFCNSVYL